MEKEIREFVIYLHDVKKTSENTELSYKRDLQKLQSFLKEQGIEGDYEGIRNCVLGYKAAPLKEAAPRKEHYVYRVK